MFRNDPIHKKAAGIITSSDSFTVLLYFSMIQFELRQLEQRDATSAAIHIAPREKGV